MYNLAGASETKEQEHKLLKRLLSALLKENAKKSETKQVSTRMTHYVWQHPRFQGPDPNTAGKAIFALYQG